VALKRVGEALKTDELGGAIAAGYSYWKSHFFRSDGAPKYYNNKVYPIDVHSVAQAILTFLAFADIDVEAESMAVRTAAWGVRHMQDPVVTSTSKFTSLSDQDSLHAWSQAWMQRRLPNCSTGMPKSCGHTQPLHPAKELIW
jgi:hypothetical protein